jgi:hypothetical protein
MFIIKEEGLTSCKCANGLAMVRALPMLLNAMVVRVQRCIYRFGL